MIHRTKPFSMTLKDP